MTMPDNVFAMACHGGIIGFPVKPVTIVQSKVRGSNPKPDVPPKTWLTTGFCGKIHVMKTQMLKNFAAHQK